ncbi:MAG: glycoside-pentoside-hexuronide (GPH):cation symporter [Lachnospiraceae bacterium]|nr:glycoside-pentoside-hexuronide (GPH):cation symporter [Lachnospiraceae bacterium]
MDNKTEKRNLWCFPVGTIGRDMLYVLVANFLLTYILFTRELTPAQLTAITAIMVAARIFDALNDPVMGNIIERTRSKWGKFKPWLLAGALSTTVVIIFLFNTDLQGWPFIIAFGISYFAFSITYTMNDIAYWGMIPALGTDGDTRNKFTSRATLFAGIGNAIASTLIPLFTTGAMALGGNTKSAYGMIAVIIGIITPTILLATLFGVKENRDDMKTAPEPIGLKHIVTTITRNDQLMWVSLCFLIQELGNGIIVGGLGSTYIYFTYGYKGGLYSVFSTVGLSATAFLMIFYPTISRLIGRKRLMNILLVVSMAGYAMMLVSPVFGSGNASFWILSIGFMVASFGQYGYYLIMMISILNTVEYNEYKFGKRDEAIIASLRPFLTKMSSALVVLVTSVTYLIYNVTDYTNQISSYENAAASGKITDEEKMDAIEKVISTVMSAQKGGLLFVMVLLSAGLMAVSYFIYKKHYILDEDEYDRICRELGK